MKTIRALMIALMLPVLVSAATGSKPFNLFLGAGLSFPTAHLNDAYNIGLNVEGAAGFDLIPNVQILPTIAYHSFSLDNHIGDGGGLTIVMFGGDARLTFPVPEAAARPYLLGGFGFAHLATNAITTELETYGAHSETQFYFDFGGGIDRRLTAGLRMYFQVRYVNIATKDFHSYMFPLTIGVKF